MTEPKAMQMQPLVSVAIPVYNGGKYLDKCLESVLNQTYQNWECLINNNCSEDDTLEIANRYAARDQRFKVFSNDTFLRITQNWNKACSRASASSRFLKVLGADDWLFPESLEKMVEVMVRNPSVGICSSYRLNDLIVDMYGLNIWDGNVYNGKEILYRQLTRTLDISGSNSTVMFAVDHLKRIPRYPKVFDETTAHEDTELEYELMNSSDVGFVFQVLSYTRRHEKALTTTEVYRLNTLLQLDEKVLWVYKGNDRKLNHLYRWKRLEYAWFMLRKILVQDKKSLDWHRKYIVRKFKWHEYLLGMLTCNKFSQLAGRLFRKVFRIA